MHNPNAIDFNQRPFVAIWETTFGPDHPSVAAGLDNMATNYRDMGRYDLSEQFSARALAIREKVLGPNDASVTTSLNNLAIQYLATADLPKAVGRSMPRPRNSCTGTTRGKSSPRAISGHGRSTLR